MADITRADVETRRLGSSDLAQVDGWIAAGSLRLTSEDLAEISEAVQRTGAGSGPTGPGDRPTDHPHRELE